MKKSSNSSLKKKMGVVLDESTRTFTVYLEEPGDASVGIPRAEGSVAIIVPDWLIPEDCAQLFEKALAKFVQSWSDDGYAMTRAEKDAGDEAMRKADEEAQAQEDAADERASRRFF